MKTKLFLTAAVLAAATAGAACAADDFQPAAKGTIMLNVRVSDAIPWANSPLTTNTGAATGLDIRASSSLMPTIGLSYFVTDNISVEVIAGSTYHQIKAVGGTTNLKVYDTWLLPPTVTAQYHFMSKSRLSPYLGAGLGYMEFFAGKNLTALNVNLSDNFAPSVNAGLDYALTGKWSANLDVKQILYSTHANVNSGAMGSNVPLNPTVVSVGVGYKF